MYIYRALRKLYYLTLGKIPVIDRFCRYRNPQDYWKNRGGDTYFAEQEAVTARTERSVFIAESLSRYDCKSIVEIGCGYGKQLKNIFQAFNGNVELAGCDFSGPQLAKLKEYFPDFPGRVVESDAEKIPFESKSFDLAFSSAVILHNHYEKAQKIISEMIRISRKYIAHNEDTDITFSRYGYDMKKTYEKMGFKILESGEIPCANEPGITQFTVVEIPEGIQFIEPRDVPLQYHSKS